ncbi:Signal transduction histidine kinase [Parapedobacter composti]|uniref:histidine kinase n=1 Tax=Parapedobacter composti TaxID=623281 RepID=A0A1I1E0R1_9SPHI|nr:two-component regulator propeller domain-containing protein [Parapedobacter composti]SFB80859.1 Signal transduction histidine kinase [Parapedobacter composti]
MRYRYLTLFLLLYAPWSIGQSLNLRFGHITSEDGLPQNTIHGIAKDKYGFMWFGTWSGLCRYDGYRFKIYRYDPENPKSVNNNRIHNILKDNNQDIWVMTFDEQILCKYNYETDDFERVPLERVPDDIQKSIFRKNHHQHTTFKFKDYEWRLERRSNTLVETYLPSREIKRYSANPGIRGSLNDSYVSDVYLDDQDILWVGTYSNGINKANLNANPFHYHHFDPTSNRSIIDDNVRTLCEDNEGNLWVGTRDKGITIIGKNGTYRHLRHDPADPHSLRSDQIRRIYCDSRGWLWIGTKSGLDCYLPKTGEIRHYDQLTPGHTAVFGIIEDRQQCLWFATWSGIYQYSPATDSVIHFNPSETLFTEHTWTIMEDSHGKLWVGTEGGGISVLNKDTPGEVTLVEHYIHKRDSANSISDNRIYVLYEDSEGYIWIGTGNGLDCYDPRQNTFRRFSISPNGLPNGMIAGILEDNNGFLWVSHKAGISRIDKKSLSIRNYSQQDGLQSNEFLEGAALKSRFTNNLYFGGAKGYNVFNPDSITCDQRPPQIVFTELQILNKQIGVNREINGRVLLEKPLYLTEELALTHRDKSIAIEFAALHYTNPVGNRYAYMLEGFDEDWIYTDASHRVATYSNLAAGNYVFKVKASNSDGIWNPVPKTLKISVAPAFWLSKWAYVVYVLFIVSLLYAYYYYVVRYAKLKNRLAYEAILHEKERELHESKVQFFTNISHEIKTPLTLILTPIEQLTTFCKDNLAIQKQLQTMKENGDRLLKLINQLLDMRRFETGNEHLLAEKRDMVSFVEDTVEAFRPMAEQKHIQLETVTPLAVLVNDFDADKLEKVINNLLSNAFKFTPEGGEIRVSLTLDRSSSPEVAVITVSDNGIGIREDEMERIFQPFQRGSVNKSDGTGIGLAYSKSLVELHGGTISVSSNRGKGKPNRTTFFVRIPVTEDNTTEQFRLNDSGETPQLRGKPDLPLAHQGQHTRVVDPSKPYTLLVVEDNDAMRRYLSDTLSHEYNVLEAANGAEGLDLALAHAPDLIVSDYMMPEMDGFELCRRVKEHMLISHVPFILLTARTPIQYEIEGLETGADDYIVKPFNLTLLLLKIKNMLLNKTRLQEKFKTKITLEPSGFNLESPDEKLLKKVLSFIDERLSDSDLNVDDICEHIGLSRAQLYRKMKALTGLSIVDIVKEIRLKRAKQLLTDRKFNVNEISFLVGFNDPDYFRKCFKSHFGYSPSEYSKHMLAKHERHT